jgi:hypothetical protein
MFSYAWLVFKEAGDKKRRSVRSWIWVAILAGVVLGAAVGLPR